MFYLSNIPHLKPRNLREGDKEKFLLAEFMHRDIVIPLFRHLQYDHPKYQNMCYTSKDSTNPEKGHGPEFGYYVSYRTVPLIEIIKHYNIKSFMDLGCGAGLLLSTLRVCLPDLSVGGFDNEEILINHMFSNLHRGFKDFKVKDIITITPEDIKAYDALYFWEPFTSSTLAEKFANNLAEVCTKNQYIIYQSHGSIGEYLAKTNKFITLAIHDQYVIFKKK